MTGIREDLKLRYVWRELNIIFKSVTKIVGVGLSKSSKHCAFFTGDEIEEIGF